jgi:hypothetical protein
MHFHTSVSSRPRRERLVEPSAAATAIDSVAQRQLGCLGGEGDCRLRRPRHSRFGSRGKTLSWPAASVTGITTRCTLTGDGGLILWIGQEVVRRGS